MAPVRKNKSLQKAKSPPRQKEEPEPRRSNRTPKISEKLKKYLDDQGDEDQGQRTRKSGRPPKVTEKLKELNSARSSTKKQAKKDQQNPGHDLLGEDYKEAKVVIKALSKSTLQSQAKKYAFKKEPRVTLKRLGNASAGNKKSSRVVTSKLVRRKLTSRRTTPNSNSQSALKKIVVKAEVVQSSPPGSYKSAPRGRGRPRTTNIDQEPVVAKKPSPGPRGRGKRKLLNTDHKPEPAEKRVRRTSKGSKEESHEGQEGDVPQVKAKTRFDPLVKENLYNFGIKVQEVLSFNRKTYDKLLDDWENTEPTTEEIEKKLGGGESGDLEAVMKWLEEEQRQRKEYQQELLETLRASHRTNMALYSHMLSVLKSVTASA